VSGFVRGFLVLNSLEIPWSATSRTAISSDFAVAGSSGNYLYGNTANSNRLSR